LAEAMARFTASGGGVVVYLRPTGGLRSCALGSGPRDTARSGEHAITSDWILADLGVRPTSSGTEPAQLAEWVAARQERPLSRIAG
jgi:hypothetical protein